MRVVLEIAALWLGYGVYVITILSDVIEAEGAIFGAYVAYVCLCITRVFGSSYAYLWH